MQLGSPLTQLEALLAVSTAVVAYFLLTAKRPEIHHECTCRTKEHCWSEIQSNRSSLSTPCRLMGFHSTGALHPALVFGTRLEKLLAAKMAISKPGLGSLNPGGGAFQSVEDSQARLPSCLKSKP